MPDYYNVEKVCAHPFHGYLPHYAVTQVDHKDTLSIIKDRRIDRTCILNESQISTRDVGTEYDTGKTKCPVFKWLNHLNTGRDFKW